MAEGFIGEVRIFSGTFAPRNWLYCHGQILAISQFDTLYSIIGTQYGGDGRATFALPDLRGRANFSSGNVPGLQPKYRGMYSGFDFTTITDHNLPPHSHPITDAEAQHSLVATGSTQFNCQNTEGNSQTPEGKSVAALKALGGDKIYGDDNDKIMKAGSVNPDNPVSGNIVVSGHTSSVGQGQMFHNILPFSVADYIICWSGIYPQRP